MNNIQYIELVCSVSPCIKRPVNHYIIFIWQTLGFKVTLSGSYILHMTWLVLFCSIFLIVNKCKQTNNVFVQNQKQQCVRVGK